MTPQRRAVINFCRKIAALLCWAMAANVFWGVTGLFKNWKNEAGDYIFTILFGLPFFVLLPLGLAWLGWRLWARWNAATVRWAAGTAIAFLIFEVMELLSRWFEVPANEPGASPAVWIASIPLLLLGAVLFRWLTRAITRAAELNEVLDVYGQPLGHARRVKFFAFVLGWSIWTAGVSASRWIKIPKLAEPEARGMFALGSAILGYATYKLFIYLMQPRTKPAQPVDQAFEVIVPKNPQ